jgi:hypothetical protein
MINMNLKIEAPGPIKGSRQLQGIFVPLRRVCEGKRDFLLKLLAVADE